MDSEMIKYIFCVFQYQLCIVHEATNEALYA